MKIVLATFGSLGDLHPVLAIARELQRRGHAPVVATFDAYAADVAAAGIAFEPMRPSAGVLGDIRETMERLLHPRRGPEFLVRGLFMPHVRASYADLDRIARGADLIVSHPITFAAPLVAEQRGLPWASLVLAPMSLMSSFDPPLLPGAPWLLAVRRLGVTPYRLVFGLLKRSARSWEEPLHELRRELGIPTAHAAQFEGQYSPHLNLALFSPLLARPQPDWPARTLVCGFPSYEGATPDAATSAALETFLAGGPAPLVFGLGSSAVAVADAFWREAATAVEQLGCRAIFLTGRESIAPAASDRIAAFPYLPYSAVFPRAAAVVHTCGIGTLAQALRAGRPQLIVPVAFDQPDNAARAVALGVGGVLPFRAVTTARLAAALDEVLNDARHADAGAAVAAKVAAEDGAAVAATALERMAP